MVEDQLPLLGKREVIYMLSFTCNHVVSVGEVSSSSWSWDGLHYLLLVLPEPSI